MTTKAGQTAIEKSREKILDPKYGRNRELYNQARFLAALKDSGQIAEDLSYLKTYLTTAALEAGIPPTKIDRQITNGFRDSCKSKLHMDLEPVFKPERALDIIDWYDIAPVLYKYTPTQRKIAAALASKALNLSNRTFTAGYKEISIMSGVMFSTVGNNAHKMKGLTLTPPTTGYYDPMVGSTWSLSLKSTIQKGKELSLPDNESLFFLGGELKGPPEGQVNLHHFSHIYWFSNHVAWTVFCHMTTDDYLGGREIGRRSGVSKSAVYRNLAIMKKDGFVEEVEGEGYKKIITELNPEELPDLQERLEIRRTRYREDAIAYAKKYKNQGEKLAKKLESSF